jgi:metal-responsive CopG/Arc/MetJ family transcriptional regulator
MTDKEKTVHKKPRGRPAGQRFRETIPVRLTPDMIKTVDAWARRNDVSRSQAIRDLIEAGLKAKARK